ncbi:MAG: chlorophyll synthesis pathway protein BchC [Pseudomonadota bacterium]
MLRTTAIVLEKPESLNVTELPLAEPVAGDVVVDIAWSGVSTGTERLLYTGRMPDFPGMGYPLVPGYESVGTVAEAGSASGLKVGDTVFVPGANCYGDVRGLFGGAASRIVVPGARVIPVDAALGANGTLMALAATAYHALSGQTPPDLIVGHGILGRLLARITVALGHPAPSVWETNTDRRKGANGYAVIAPEADARRDYRAIYDVSGDSGLLDTLIGRLAPGGEVVLAGFYPDALSFSFPSAFMREARIRCAAEWKPDDLAATRALIDGGTLALSGLITHHQPAANAGEAYRTAFSDPGCLKMILDWEGTA